MRRGFGVLSVSTFVSYMYMYMSIHICSRYAGNQDQDIALEQGVWCPWLILLPAVFVLRSLRSLSVGL